MKHEHALQLTAKLAAGTSKAKRSALAAASPSPFAGHWKNQMGSTMDLTVQGSIVSGQYSSADSSTGKTTTGALSGVINDHVIAFSVNWPSPSITSWTGHLVTENGSAIIETLWFLAMEMEDPNDQSKLWSSVFSGADRFVR